MTVERGWLKALVARFLPGGGADLRRASTVSLAVEQLEQRCLLDGATNPVAMTPVATNPATIPLPTIGVNAYWDARETQNWAVAQQGHANVVFLGDSITDFFTTTGAPWWNAFLAPLGTADFAISGFTTSQVLQQIDSGEVAATTPNVVVLNIGINNLGQGQTPTQVAGGIAAIVTALQQQLPQTQIVLTSMLPALQSPINNPFRTLVPQTNALISQFASASQLRYADFSNFYLAPDGSEWPGLMMADGVHPSTVGYAYYAGGVYSSVIDALEANPPLPPTPPTQPSQPAQPDPGS